MVLQAYALFAGLVAVHGGNLGQVDDGGAVDLPELLFIQLGHQFPDRRADQEFLFTGLDPGVLLVGTEKQDVVHRHHARGLAAAALQPAHSRGILLRIELALQGEQRLHQRPRSRRGGIRSGRLNRRSAFQALQHAGFGHL